MQQRGNSFYDNIFQPQMMGMSFPVGMMNYQPGPIINEPYYWTGNNMNRGFSYPQMSLHNGCNYMFPHNDNLGKGMPYVGNNISVGPRQFPVV